MVRDSLQANSPITSIEEKQQGQRRPRLSLQEPLTIEATRFREINISKIRLHSPLGLYFCKFLTCCVHVWTSETRGTLPNETQLTNRAPCRSLYTETSAAAASATVEAEAPVATEVAAGAVDAAAATGKDAPGAVETAAPAVDSGSATVEVAAGAAEAAARVVEAASVTERVAAGGLEVAVVPDTSVFCTRGCHVFALSAPLCLLQKSGRILSGVRRVKYREGTGGKIVM